MTLTGSFRTMGLPDVLQWLAMGRKSGTLHFQRLSLEKRLVLREGRIVSTWSNDPRESLGQFLIRSRRVSEEQLFKALLRQETQGRLLGEILVGEGVLSSEQLREVLQKKAEEMLYDLFLWPEGSFHFQEGELPEQLNIAIDLGVHDVVLEGVRRLDEWHRIREVIPTAATTFRVLRAPLEPQQLTTRQVLSLCAQGRTLTDICLEMRRSEFEAAALMMELYEKGLIAIDRVGAPEEPADHVALIEEHLAGARRALEAKLYDEARRHFEDVLALDRLNQHAKKGLIALIEARNSERIAKSIPLDKVPVLKVDLVQLTREALDPQEGFVISRINGAWDVRSILKLCPMGEEKALLIVAGLIERQLVELRDP